MCAEFVKEINTLLDVKKSSLVNATRYSYLISQQVDIETQQIDSFASCVAHQAEHDPEVYCIDIMTQPNYFDLYSVQDKADTCQKAAMTWKDLKTSSVVNNSQKPDVCAILTSEIFQMYSFHLQDLSDGIIGALTQKMSSEVKQSSQQYADDRKEQEVKMFLEEQSSQFTVQSGQALVKKIMKTD